MVVEFLLDLVVSIVSGLVSSMPAHTVDTNAVENTAGTVGAMGATLNGYAPVALLGTVLAVLVAMKLALLAWQGVLFIYHQFWGSS